MASTRSRIVAARNHDKERHFLAPVCPVCRKVLVNNGMAALICCGCSRLFPSVAGLPDLRLHSDRYLDLASEREKAERLHALEPVTNLAGIAEAYYAMTDDVVDHRRARFLRHIAGAEARGEALASRLPRDGHTLEVGCGTGGLLVAAALSGRSIVGVDIASRWLVVARRRLTDRGVSVPLVAAEADRLPWPDRTFDTVVSDSVVEHLDDPSLALTEWRRILRPGGRLIVWSPNRFTLTTDPHAGLWGIGGLPRKWVPAYLRLRGKYHWLPRTLSAVEARQLALSTGWEKPRLCAPPVSREWARTRPTLEQIPYHLYELARRLPLTGFLLKTFGPLWELQAEAKSG